MRALLLALLLVSTPAIANNTAGVADRLNAIIAESDNRTATLKQEPPPAPEPPPIVLPRSEPGSFGTPPFTIPEQNSVAVYVPAERPSSEEDAAVARSRAARQFSVFLGTAVPIVAFVAIPLLLFWYRRRLQTLNRTWSLRLVFTSVGLLVALFAFRDSLLASMDMGDPFSPNGDYRMAEAILVNGWGVVALSAVGLFGLYRLIVMRSD